MKIAIVETIRSGKTLLRMERVAARLEKGGDFDPGVRRYPIRDTCATSR